MFTVVGENKARFAGYALAPSTHLSWTSGVTANGSNIQVPGVLTVLDYAFCYINGARYRILTITPGTLNTLIALDREVVETDIRLVSIGYSARDGRNPANWRINDNAVVSVDDSQTFLFKKPFKFRRRYRIELLNEIDLSFGVLTPQFWDFSCDYEGFVQTNLTKVRAVKGAIIYTFDRDISECRMIGVKVDSLIIKNNTVTVYTQDSGDITCTLTAIFDINGNHVTPVTRTLSLVADQEMVAIGGINYIIKKRKKLVIDDYVAAKVQDWIEEERS